MGTFGGEKSKGSVKWFNSEKGFGFIIDDDNDEVFVHQTAVHAQGFRSLAEGEEVEFEVEIDERQRKKAHNVTGPDGAFVLGAPRPDTNYGFGGGSNSSFDSGFGGGNNMSGNRKKSFGDDDDMDMGMDGMDDFDFGTNSGPQRGKPNYGAYDDDDDDKW